MSMNLCFVCTFYDYFDFFPDETRVDEVRGKGGTAKRL